MKYYKLLTQDLKSYNNTQWELNKTITVSIPGNTMCTDQVLHCYNHPLLAVILNPIHANILNPRLFEIEVDEIVASDGLKFASKSQTLIKELEPPKISLYQKIEFGIGVAKLVYKNSAWNAWADSWLSGKVESKESASYAAAAYAAYAAYANAAYDAANAYAADAAVYAANAAAYAANAAVYAANAAVYAANAANAAGAVYAANAANAAGAAANNTAANAANAAAKAFSNKNEFNQKMIDIIEEIVKVKE